MKIPVLLLVFANDNHDALPLLETELRQIENDLAEIRINSEIITERLENADADSLFKRLSMLQASHNPMRIFHFSGHAGGTKLLLEDGIVDASGIARFLNLFKDEMGNNPLKLVFLNGCSTQKQVKLLHEKGIPAVIATSRPISDSLAMEFSRKFYETFLLKAKNLETAFEEAASFIESKNNQSAEIYRGVSLSDDDDMPWGLYINKGQDRILSWRFPLSSVLEVTDIPEVNGGVNRIYEALRENGLNITIKDKGQIHASFEDKQEALIKEFSWLIGVPLRRLFTKTLGLYGKNRLLRLVDAYTHATRFIAYILLSQVMEDKILRKDERLLALFPIKKENYPVYDFLKLQKCCHDLMKEQKIKIFFKEIEKVLQLWEADKEIAEMFAFMEDFRRIIYTNSVLDKWEEKEIADYAQKVEGVLTELLTHFGFLARYRLLTVTDIEIHRLRFQIQTKFEHFYGELHGNYKSFNGFVKGKFDDYAYSHSVLLVRKGREQELDNPDNYLVLSPLIFDNNSYSELKINEYRSKTPNIFFYLYTETGEKRKHVFFDINFDSLIENPKSIKEVIRGNDKQPMLDKLYEQMRVFE